MPTRRERRRLNRQRWRARKSKTSKASTTKRSKSRRKTARGFKSDYALGRAYGIRAPKSLRGRKARSYVGKKGLARARRTAGRVLSYNQLMKSLQGSKLKAWVCAGPRRTGCGGGKRRYGGSRQLGVLRP